MCLPHCGTTTKRSETQLGTQEAESFWQTFGPRSQWPLRPSCLLFFPTWGFNHPWIPHDTQVWPRKPFSPSQLL